MRNVLCIWIVKLVRENTEFVMYRILRLSVLIISLSGGNVVAHADNLSPRVNIGMSEYSGNRIQHSDIDARFFLSGGMKYGAEGMIFRSLLVSVITT